MSKIDDFCYCTYRIKKKILIPMGDNRYFTSSDIKKINNEAFFKSYINKLSIIKNDIINIFCNYNSNISNNIYN